MATTEVQVSTNDENDKIIEEKIIILDYLKNKYKITFQFEENIDGNFINIIALKDNDIENFFYEIKMNFNDFKNLNSRVLRLYDTIEEIYKFISWSIKDNEISIKELNNSSITLLFTSKIKGFDEPLTVEINLKKKNYNIDDTVKIMLTELINAKKEVNKLKNEIIELKNENKELKEKELEKENELKEIITNSNIFEKNEDIDFIKTRLLQIPGWNNKKFKLKLIFQSSKNGTSIADFRRMCNNIPNNIILIKTSSNQRFGGFTKLCWTGQADFYGKTDKNDDNAFCFSLTKNKIYNIIKGKPAIGDYNNTSGPYFLYNIFYLDNNLRNGKCGGSHGSYYSGQDSNYEINNGSSTFTVTEFEFYQILFIF